MNKAPSKEETLGHIKFHVENMDKYLGAGPQKLIFGFPFAFLGKMSCAGLLFILVLATIVAVETSFLSALFFLMLTLLPVATLVTAVYTDFFGKFKEVL